MRIVFMGTPDIAAAALEGVLAAGHEVCAVFTREDKPVGRRQVLTPPPVKVTAEKYGLPIFQPKTLRTGAEEILKELRPELIVVVAYGRILPPAVLAVPAKGCVNLHVSLLPKYRGAAPVQWAVINGDKETGVTIMRLDEGVDTGDILETAPVSIGENETSGELFERVTAIGVRTLCETLTKIEAGTERAVPQDHSKATLAPPLTKEMALFTFDDATRRLHNLIRGLNPWPAAYFLYEGKKVKVMRSLLTEGTGRPGEVLSLHPLTVACREGALVLCEVVPEGSRAMKGEEWAAGRRLAVGDRLSKEEGTAR